MKSRKVHLPGHGVFWFLQEEDGGGGLVPLSFCTGETGELLPGRFLQDAYAMIGSWGGIRKGRSTIGTIRQLRDWPSKSMPLSDPCGCRYTLTITPMPGGGDDFQFNMRRCPTCAAAAQLLAALREIHRIDDDWRMPISDKLNAIRHYVDAAIAATTKGA